jgi:hypothetical protein
MRDEETDEAKIRETESQIGRDDCLQRSADAPKVSDFEPAPISCPECADDDDHRPIAQLKRKEFVPAIDAEVPRDENIGDIIYYEQRRDREPNRSLQSRRSCSMDDEREDERQNNGQENDDEVRRTPRVKFRRVLHLKRRLSE